MRHSTAIPSAALLALLLGGCIVTPPGPEPPPPGYPPPGGGTVVVGGGGPAGVAFYTLVLDFADLSDGFGGGPPPDTYVTVLIDGTAATSSIVYGDYAPQWNEPLLDADPATFADGIDFQVWADDGGGAALAGELVYTPAPDDFSGAAIQLGTFDYVTNAQIHFEPSQ
ncbi:MAG TPA: hypothetical protein VFF06_22425 [Polyangia bacterium]|nr:hypothetical protein [Polyangia bacterium]